EAPPPHLAQHRERHLLAPGEIAQPAQLAAAKGDEHPRLALAEEVGVETEPLLELDPGPEARPSERALGERHGESTLADVVRRAQETLPRGAETEPVQALLGLEVDPGRRAAHHAVDHGEILARAELLTGAPEENDDVAFCLPPRGQVQLEVLEEP